MAIGLTVGQAIRSRTGEWYKCIQHLGTGGNAITFLVLSTSGTNKGSLFALKIFQRVTDANRLSKFHGEIQFLESCSHPSIMKVYDSGEFSASGLKHPFVVMEFLPNHLYSEMRRGQMDITAKLSLTTQLLSALAYLAKLEKPIVHRDVKPKNIFIKGKTCVLGDFGLMKVVPTTPNEIEEEEDRADMKAYIGMPLYYRTPDLVAYTKGEAPISTKSDIFQLGLVLAELFTGRNPCKAVEDKLSPVELEAIGRIPGSLGSRIFHILEKMLNANPDERDTVDLLLDHWSGIFEESVEKAHDLNGKAL